PISARSGGGSIFRGSIRKMGRISHAVKTMPGCAEMIDGSVAGCPRALGEIERGARHPGTPEYPPARRHRLRRRSDP
ncbi:hypothetical protein RZS08_53455, partial [Arthrospira platensis SPKY1]|nr:hypothetical protein [Arthrospira platensis SPKY1]